MRHPDIVTPIAQTATRQFAGLILAPVDPHQLDKLRRLLAQVGQQTVASMQGHAVVDPIVPFHSLATVHYARFVLLEDKGTARATLAFGTDYDGPEGEEACGEPRAREHHHADLLRHAGAGLERIFECCEGYRRGRLKAYLDQHRRRASTFYVGSSGRSKNQILYEARLRRRVEKILDANTWTATLPEKVREEVLRELQQEGSIPPFPAQPDLSHKLSWFKLRLLALAIGGLGLSLFGLWRWLELSPLGLLAAALAVLAGLAAALGLALLRFRHLERTDPQFQPEFSARALAGLEAAASGENYFLQNQLTHLVQIKPGLLRWCLIRAVFTVLQVLAENLYNKGKLGGIPSIHFARWVLIPNGGVLFFSNFDSSWQSYLGDFIDQASSGLTAVWSNTRGYPRTNWLLEAGSRDAGRFLAWTRQHQLPTQVWYCAYPGLSIVNINDNTEVRRGLADRPAVDAASWLFRLRAVDQLRTDQLFGEERTRDPSLPLKDIQGAILWGYGHMPEARFLLLRVDRREPDLLPWIGRLALNSAAATQINDAPAEPLLNIAFSYAGLRALGVDEELCASFSTAYVQGSDDEYRARVNGDVEESAPECWAWGSRANPVHVVLLVYAATKASAARFAGQYIEEAKARGLTLVRELEGTTLPGRKEHFGFRDGIAQPTIQGSGRAELAGNTVAAGEFLLGQRDGYGNITSSPHSGNGFNVGLNGSYLVFRQLEQDVEAFWRFCAEKHGVDGAIALASKMVGRWPSGAPLLRHPDRDPADARFADDDNFTYIANDEDNDRYGARCPFGAHIRRTNPRDWQLGAAREESLTLANLHRIIRRGRPYGEPLDPDMSVPALLSKATAGGAPRAERGLQFLCFNANIDRQFEFIQQQWCNNPKFAGLNSDPDPLLGSRCPASQLGVDGAGFTVQTDVKTGVSARRTGLPSFVKVVGSGYFFMPAIPAVRLLGAGLLEDAGVEGLESPPPDEQLHIDGLIESLGEKMKREYAAGKTLRDAHPKMHGCVSAIFRVQEDLDDGLDVGLFKRAQTYAAWVRFSNQNGKVSHDKEADIRGAAIKLMGVDGYKLIDGEEDCTTHDIVLISHDAFVTKDVAEFDQLIKSLILGKLQMLWFLLRHPRAAKNLLKSLKRHSSPLDAEYFSVAPYLLGKRAVKYKLQPSSPEKSALPGKPGYNYLREAMKARLTARSTSFDFMVQVGTADRQRTPIEDPGVAWREADAPFRKVATLEIPAQVFDTPERQELGENLSFNPWRCLPEHRPLGGISRARRQVYRALSSLRHDRNATPQQEPGERQGVVVSLHSERVEESAPLREQAGRARG